MEYSTLPQPYGQTAVSIAGICLGTISLAFIAFIPWLRLGRYTMVLTKEEADLKRVELFMATRDLPKDEVDRIYNRSKRTPGRPVVEIREEVFKGKSGSKRSPWSIRRPHHNPKHRLLNAYIRLFNGWRIVGWFCLTEEYRFKGRRGYSHGLPEIVARHWKPRGKGPVHPCAKNGGKDTRVLFLYCVRGSPSAYERGRGSKPRFEAIGYWCPSCGPVFKASPAA